MSASILPAAPPRELGYRMPAEWDRHEATWLAWPHEKSDWPGKFAPIPWVYAEIVRVLHAHERVEILCHDDAARAGTAAILGQHEVDLARVGLHVVPTDRVWTRDSGPTGVLDEHGALHWVAWRFTAWAKYDDHERDERVAAAIARLSGVAAVPATRDDGTALVLEGGGIETDGAGTMLVTEEWLLSGVQVRNPGMDRAAHERAFARWLGIRRTIWLGEGCVGDDTHGHVDDIARFTDARTVALAYEPDLRDENHARSADNLRRLELAGGLRIVKLPFPRAVMMDGVRLPASYANFYVANGIVIVPTFNDENDRAALAIIAGLFPGRRVVGIHAVDLVWGLGTLHCLTQQQPRGGQS